MHTMAKQRYCRLVLAMEESPDCFDAVLDALGRQLRKLSDGKECTRYTIEAAAPAA
jgi:hypothetical protein